MAQGAFGILELCHPEVVTLKSNDWNWSPLGICALETAEDGAGA
jgi:hypothetical protein